MSSKPNGVHAREDVDIDKRRSFDSRRSSEFGSDRNSLDSISSYGSSRSSLDLEMKQENQDLGKARFMMLAIILLCAVWSAGLIFGWAPLYGSLVRSGVYEKACPPVTPNTTVPGTNETLSPGQLEPFAEPFFSDNSTVAPIEAPSDANDMAETPKCEKQQTKLNLIYTAGAACVQASLFVSGILLNWRGAKFTATISGLIVALGAMLFAVALQTKVELFVLGYAMMGFGGAGINLSSYAFVPLFPNQTSWIVSALVGVWSLSSLWFLFYRPVYLGGVSLHAIFYAQAVLVFLTAIIFFLTFPTRPFLEGEVYSFTKWLPWNIAYYEGLIPLGSLDPFNPRSAANSRQVSRQASRQNSRENSMELDHFADSSSEDENDNHDDDDPRAIHRDDSDEDSEHDDSIDEEKGEAGPEETHADEEDDTENPSPEVAAPHDEANVTAANDEEKEDDVVKDENESDLDAPKYTTVYVTKRRRASSDISSSSTSSEHDKISRTELVIEKIRGKKNKKKDDDAGDDDKKKRKKDKKRKKKEEKKKKKKDKKKKDDRTDEAEGDENDNEDDNDEEDDEEDESDTDESGDDDNDSENNDSDLEAGRTVAFAEPEVIPPTGALLRDEEGNEADNEKDDADDPKSPGENNDDDTTVDDSALSSSQVSSPADTTPSSTSLSPITSPIISPSESSSAATSPAIMRGRVAASPQLSKDKGDGVESPETSNGGTRSHMRRKSVSFSRDFDHVTYHTEIQSPPNGEVNGSEEKEPKLARRNSGNLSGEEPDDGDHGEVEEIDGIQTRGGGVRRSRSRSPSVERGGNGVDERRSRKHGRHGRHRRRHHRKHRRGDSDYDSDEERRRRRKRREKRRKKRNQKEGALTSRWKAMARRGRAVARVVIADVLTLDFFSLTIWFAIQAVFFEFFIATIPDALTYRLRQVDYPFGTVLKDTFSSSTVNTYVTVFNILFAVGFIFVPLYAFTTESRAGFAGSFSLSTFICVIYPLIALIPWLPSQFFSYFFYSAGIQFLYSCQYGYVAERFGYEHFGILIGVQGIVTAALIPFQSVLLSIVINQFKGNFFWMYIIQACVTLLLFSLVIWISFSLRRRKRKLERREQEAREAIDTLEITDGSMVMSATSSVSNTPSTSRRSSPTSSKQSSTSTSSTNDSEHGDDNNV